MTRRGGSVETRYGWIVVFASLVIHTIALCSPIVLWVALKPIAEEFDWPRSVPSLAYSTMMIGAAAGGIAMGWWMDKRGVLQPVLFGSVMIGIGSLVASQSEGRWSLYVANGVLIGLLGQAALLTPLIANVTHWFDRRRGLAVSIIASAQGLAGTFGPPLFRYLDESYGWRGTYLIFGVFALCTMVPLAMLLRPKAPVPPPGPAREGHAVNRRVLDMPANAVQGLLCLATIGCCTAMAIPMVHLVSHGTDLGLSRADAAELLTALFAAAFVSRILYGMLADRIGGMQTLLIGSACQATMLVVFSIVTSAPALYVSAMLFGLGFAGIMPCYPLIIRLLFPASQTGWRVATFYMFALLGMAFGGWLGGHVFDLTGSYSQAFLAGSGFTVMNFCTIGFLYLRQARLGLTPLPARR
ncbi:MAG: MFS transporter [Alphaproteobacteria bacterium]|nr:MFS transporter [Alphaproteobacteria bacterium]